MMSLEPATSGDKILEDRMAPAIARALRPILFAMEQQDMKAQAENTEILDAVSRMAWRQFRYECAKERMGR